MPTKAKVRAVALGDALWLEPADIEISSAMKKPLLLDFWTFGCINCLNVVPDIKRIEAAFGDRVDIVSVHTPKFESEKDRTLLQKNVHFLDIHHPVVMDNDKRLWNAYAVKGWPTWVLIDTKGYIILQASGEGHFKSFFESINELLEIKEEPKALLLQGEELSVVEASDAWLLLGRQSSLEIYHKNKKVKTLEGFSMISGLLVVDDTAFIADRYLGKVWALDLESFRLKCLAEKLRAPWGLELIATNLFVSLAGSHKIMVISLESFAVKEIAGNGFEGLRDGVGDQVLLAQPQALAFDEDRLWFLDTETSALRYMQGNEVFTEFGEGLFTFGDDDAKHLLQHPQDMALGHYGDGCGTGRIFIADSYNGKIKVYNPQDKTMQTLIDEVSMPLSISKSGCRLYIVCLGESTPLVFDLKQMKLETLELV